MKRCARCKETKPLDQFHKNKRMRDGHHTYCKTCVCAYYRRPDVCQKLKEKMKTLRQLNGGKAWSYRACHRYYFAKSRAKRSGREFSLTMDDYLNLTNAPCIYCDGELGLSGVGLDRTDNTVGYTKDNVRPCCGTCNRIKSDTFSFEEMKKIGNVLSEIRRCRENLVQIA
jgi:hypothetical protein